ncbi:hypothetical protein BKA57DRAFT_25060 [Linnemannia elongata]|nr:hypothetical protein BKA57DRAFT_25060 [Linnemannia elongata]KAK5829283.1 hypothetical protein F5H01DRAFT_16468 [Linnemannia elongata]
MLTFLYSAALLLLSFFFSLFIFSFILFSSIAVALLLLFLHSSPLPPLSFSLSQSKISSISSSFIFYSLGPSWFLSLPLSLPLSLALIVPALSLLTSLISSLNSSLSLSFSSLLFFSLFSFVFVDRAFSLSSSFSFDRTLYIVPSHLRTLTHSLINTHTFAAQLDSLLRPRTHALLNSLSYSDSNNNNN